MKSVLHIITPQPEHPSRSHIMFFCPGCKCGHSVYASLDNSEEKGFSRWTWNGDREKPSIFPSVVVLKPGQKCHTFIRDGEIKFLADCEHELAGQTLKLEEF